MDIKDTALNLKYTVASQRGIGNIVTLFTPGDCNDNWSLSPQETHLTVDDIKQLYNMVKD